MISDPIKAILGSLDIIITLCVWDEETVRFHRINQDKTLHNYVIKKKITFVYYLLSIAR